MRTQPLPESLIDYAYNNIRENILLRKYKPGKKLLINNLSEELNISPTPIKQALNRLVTERFVENIPRRGYIVTKLTVKDAKEIVQVREMFELFSIPFAIKNQDDFPDIIEHMEDLTNKFDDVLNMDITSVLKLEADFHTSFLKLCDNKTLLDMYTSGWGLNILYFIYSSCDIQLENLSDQFSVHKQMFNKLKERDADGLAVLIKNTFKDLIELIENECID